jgi:hypothetical protein
MISKENKMQAQYPDHHINNQHNQAIEKAKVNGHIPGQTFRQGVVFCKKCNALLTYHGFTNDKHFIAGLYFSECK